MEFMKEFPDDDACLNFLWRNRYSEDGTHATCPKCKTEREFKRYEHSQQRQAWTCQACGKHLAPTAGTIFHKSSTSLHLWFYAMYLMASTRCGISAKQLERELGVTYKTAWRIAHEIRHNLMAEDVEAFDNSAPIEIDEAYIGGKRRGRKGSVAGRPGVDSHYQPVFGMVQRGGKVVVRTVDNAQRDTLLPHVFERILPSCTIYTDTWKAYDQLGKAGYKHERVNHTEKVYVSGDCHTNTIEGFWSLTKRGIGGVYHSVSKKHLQDYLSEYAWRYNRRNDKASHFETLLLRASRP
ncbi:MAG: transposase [Blastocatellia bacterium]|jgi:transposase-like protein|nr:transposase [Blastocatellia bacterium]